MPSLEQYMTHEVVARLRAALRKTDGAGAYFVGQIGGDGKITRVKAACKEGPRAPVILFSTPKTGEVVIHNHPDPQLLPTQQDEEYARRFDEKGIGYLLIDNRVEHAHLIVEGVQEAESLVPLDEEEITALLGPKGPLAQKLPRYEERAEQVEMLRGMVRAFNHDHIYMVEAGTGTGKSLAYLLPSIYWAHRNRERVVVSTKTINLQEQIFYKDIPFLQEILDIPFKASLVKGRNNYLCIRRIHQVGAELQIEQDEEQRKQLQRLHHWAQNTDTGDKSSLSFLPDDAIWSRLQADGDACQRMRCEHYKSCFYYIARRQQADADILVANHHVLFADLALRESSGNFHTPALLPPYHRIVLDEAHNIEDAASAFLGFQITPFGVLQSVGKLLRTKKQEETGLLRQIGGLLQEHQGKIKQFASLQQQLFEQVIPEIRRLRENTIRIEQRMQGLLMLEEEGELPPLLKIRVTPSFRKQGPWQEICEVGLGWSQQIRECLQLLMKFAADTEEHAKAIEKDLSSPLMEIGAAVNRLGNASATLDLFFSEEGSEEDAADAAEDGVLVRWFESQTQADGRLRLQAAPLEVGPPLGKMLYDHFGTIAFASATLTTGQKDFSFLQQRLGMVDLPESRVCSDMFPSPFDYATQSLIGIPTDLPGPNAPSFRDAICEVIFQSLESSDGRAFVLCTSFGLLRFLYERLAPRLERLAIRSLCQGQMPRHLLLQHKIEDERSVLFGTDSFWEGVDVQGRALCNVILTRLPFRVPSDPLIEARVEALESRGENSFLRYTVPSATIKFKQGFGRLIRGKQDRGTVLILDNRVVEKSYGSAFLDALPPESPRVIAPTHEVMRVLQQFHQAQTPKGSTS